MWQDGLTSNTLDVFEKISKLDCIKDLYLCGGTGVSLQIQNRLSEDLDFELLNYRGEKKNLDIASILGEISEVFPNFKKEILGEDHILCYVGNIGSVLNRVGNLMKTVDFGHFVHYYTSLWTNGYKKQAVSPLFGVGYASGFLNGFTPEYVMK